MDHIKHKDRLKSLSITLKGTSKNTEVGGGVTDVAVDTVLVVQT